MRRENAPSRTSAKYYQVIVQSILLYGSKTWVLSKAIMARLEGVHICVAYWMAKEHMPHWGAHCQWVDLSSNKVLEECGMHTIQNISMSGGRQLHGM